MKRGRIKSNDYTPCTSAKCHCYVMSGAGMWTCVLWQRSNRFRRSMVISSPSFCLPRVASTTVFALFAARFCRILCGTSSSNLRLRSLASSADLASASPLLTLCGTSSNNHRLRSCPASAGTGGRRGIDVGCLDAWARFRRTLNGTSSSNCRLRSLLIVARASGDLLLSLVALSLAALNPRRSDFEAVAVSPLVCSCVG